MRTYLTTRQRTTRAFALCAQANLKESGMSGTMYKREDLAGMMDKLGDMTGAMEGMGDGEEVEASEEGSKEEL